MSCAGARCATRTYPAATTSNTLIRQAIGPLLLQSSELCVDVHHGLAARDISGGRRPRRGWLPPVVRAMERTRVADQHRSEEHTSELQSRLHLVCRLLLEKKKN